VSASRRKGNALETWWAQRIHAVDGHDPVLVELETPTGRIGNTYRLQTDVASAHTRAECKNREDNPARLWDWLDQLGTKQLAVLVLQRNRRRPLVVLDAEEFLSLLEGIAWIES
jgi:hypothetical protein